MAKTRELLLFVPGLAGLGPTRYFERFLENFREHCRSRGLGWEPAETEADDAGQQRRVVVEAGRDDTVEYTIRLVRWNEQLPSLATMSVLEKILDGICSIFYWGWALRMWRVVSRNKFMLFQVFFTAIVLLVWYYSVVALGIMALGSNTDIADINVPAWLETAARGIGLGISQKQLTYGALFSNIGNAMKGFYFIILATVLLKSLDLSSVAQTVYVVRCYLQNRYGLQQTLCARVGKAFLPLTDGEGAFDRVTVLAHSLGCALAVESLAGLARKPVRPTRLVTLGSPLLLLSARCKRLDAAVKHLLTWNVSGLAHWTDCFAPDDWLCAHAPIPAASARTRVLEISSTTSFLDSAMGKSHDLYFADAATFDVLLDPAPWTAPLPASPA